AEKRTLLESDRKFAETSSTAGALKAFSEYSSDEIRFYRSPAFPHLGKDAMRETLAADSGSSKWEPAFSDVSNAGDLGYTYGTFEYVEANKQPAYGNYLRIWKKKDGVWKIVLDVASPAPAPPKKPE